jgi:hypothetical protein
MAKAFDKVWHPALLSQLEHMGINNDLIMWFSSYLNGRSSTVCVDGFSSLPFSSNSGVPQGCVLSPTLFIIFINDLLKITSNPIHAYADDCTIHCSFKCAGPADVRCAREAAAASINKDLVKVLDWAHNNRVTFNSSKTQLMMISNRKFTNLPQVMMNGSALTYKSSMLCLGIKIDHKLTFSEHIAAVAKSTSRKLSVLHRARLYFNSKQRGNLYKAFIAPCLEYCCHIWADSGKANMDKLDSIQRRAIKLIDCPTITDNISSLSHRREVASLSLFFRYISGACSLELGEMIHVAAPSGHGTRMTTLLNPTQVIVQRHRVISFKNSFFRRTSPLWNRIPSSIFLPENKTSLTYFKRQVHRYLKVSTNLN